MKADFTRVTVKMRQEACDSMIKPCCTDQCCVTTEDQVTDALNAGIEYGIQYAMKMIAYRIRAELVCCPDEEIDDIEDGVTNRGLDFDDFGHRFHAICYWGEMGARLAEDPHSMLESPYECDGRHPGECWNGRICEERKHPICDKCFACRLCEFQECCTQKGEGDEPEMSPLPEDHQ